MTVHRTDTQVIEELERYGVRPVLLELANDKSSTWEAKTKGGRAPRRAVFYSSIGDFWTAELSVGNGDAMTFTVEGDRIAAVVNLWLRGELVLPHSLTASQTEEEA